MADDAQRLILASGSPQRLDLLRAHGFSPKVRRPDVDETPQPGEDPAALVERLAMAKLVAVVDNHETGLAADTVVVLDGEVLGKPGRPDWATDMLRRLSGRTHEVVGGLAVCHGGYTISGVVRTLVTFREFDDDEIDAYVATGEPLDKAGAYAIQGGAAGFVTKVDGCRENVVGLSIPAVLAALKSLGAQSAG
ncbi:MAG: nucleoside triphosphate pyrophosphatase [Acidimicrobiales bacterium]|nr:nucleoside triphosphate pyrophosphatase [Acidimicrobiales bacterium]MDP6648662.1 nucleoside triphosphate pyrophosphatase [Acidimicrobiales bacterium]MDP6760197.1 nucleoside triphosphate pyrophosphatase [Acidimicrobiales bacterium]